MLKNVRKWLEYPVFPREEERNIQANIVNTINLYLFPILALSVLSVFFLTPTDERSLALSVILGLLLLNGISRVLLSSGRVEASGAVIAISTWTADIVVAALSGGISSPMMFAAITVAVVFGLLLRQSVGTVLIGMTILAGFVMAILPNYDTILPRLFHFSELDVWFILLLCMLFAGMAVSRTLKRLENALNQFRQKADETAVKSEAMFRSMFDNIKDGMIFSDGAGLVSFRSPTYQRIDGYSNVEWSRFEQFELVHPEDRDLVQRNWQAVLANPAVPVQLEYRLHHKNGAWVWVESVFQNLLNDPDVRSLVITTRNIDERKRAEIALHRSETKFRAVIENSHDGILFLDAENRITYRSPSYAQINGYTDEERVGRDGFDIIHPDDLERLSQLRKKIEDMPGGRAVVEYRILHKNGDWVWVESTLNNLLDDPDVGAVVLVSRDITERKRLENELLESKRRYTVLFEKSSMPVVLMKLPEVFIADANEAAEKLAGFTREEMLGRNAVELGMIDDAGYTATIARYEEETGLVDTEVRILTKSGEERIILFNTNPVEIDGQVYAITSMQDITGRKQAEIRLMESEERFRSLVEQSSEGVILTDESGTIIEWNRAQARMTGISQEEAIGMPVWEMQHNLMHPEQRSLWSLEYLRNDMQNMFVSGNSPYFYKQMEFEIESRNGERRDVIQSSFPIVTKNGYRLASIARDVTEAKQLEQRLRNHDEDVLRSALEERQRLARELHDSVGQVLGYVSFQTEAARELYASGKPEEADAQLARLASIAQDAHADVREYILNLRVAPSTRDPLFKTLQTYLDGFTRNYNIETSLVIGQGMDENTIDANTQLNLFRVAQEALSNIRKHAGARQAVVTFELDGDKVRMTVQDDGHGFDPQDLLNDDVHHFGVSFMNERVSQLRGDIRFESALQSGTQVVVEIPIRKEEAV